ncbi:MAG: hypothetical protein NC834_02610 [Candidatus Omnitrophica bacterium]|nr:hypothetical protein [Candidatus Omnitrophota bacterium]
MIDMALKSRLKKIENTINERNKPLMSPMIITLYEDDNEEEVYKYLETKYGEDFKNVQKIILRMPTTREEARRNKENIMFYKEIEEL